MRRIALILAAIAVSAAACNSGSSGGRTRAPHGSLPAPRTGSSRVAADGACRPDIVPTICVTLHVTGAVTVSGTAATTAPAPPDAGPKTSCHQLATASGSTERDLGGGIAALAGHRIAWDEDLGHWSGPGRYDVSRSDFYLSIDASSFMAYRSSASITVGADFATTYTFTDLRSDAGTISGTLSWTCLDPT